MPGGWYKGLELQDVWSLDRHGEAERFKPHNKLKNRKLLWHGTNVAVVAAILGSGLRIMPHSGGRVGKGIYLASEQAKSAGYVGCAQDGKQRTGVMFLVEAALGKEHHITRDDSSLRAAPKGFDSIVAKGYGEPDPKQGFDCEVLLKLIVNRHDSENRWTGRHCPSRKAYRHVSALERYCG